MFHRLRGMPQMFLAGTVSVAALTGATAALAVDLDLMISDVDGKAEILREMAERYTAANPDVTINFNLVGYDVIRDQLTLQLEAGTGPDIVMTTNLGTHSPFMLDLTPYVDAAEWEANYGAVLPWYRAGRESGIYGFHSAGLMDIEKIKGPFNG